MVPGHHQRDFPARNRQSARDRTDPDQCWTHVSVVFSKPVADSAASLANFSIPGLSISSAVLDVLPSGPSR